MEVDLTLPLVGTSTAVAAVATASTVSSSNSTNTTKPLQKDEKDDLKVFDSLENLQMCLWENKYRNLVLFPRKPVAINDGQAQMLALAIASNTSLSSLTLEEVHFLPDHLHYHPHHRHNLHHLHVQQHHQHQHQHHHQHQHRHRHHHFENIPPPASTSSLRSISIQRIAHAVQQHPNIKRLTLYDNRLGNDGVLALMQVFSNPSRPNPTVESTKNNPMIHNHHHDQKQQQQQQEQQQQEQQHHNPAMAPTPNLISYSIQALCLCGNEIGDQGAYWLSKGLSTNPHIQELDLSSNQITEQGAFYLAQLLLSHTTTNTTNNHNHHHHHRPKNQLTNSVSGPSTSTQLTAFILNSNQIGVKGAISIARALQHNQSLDVLGLCGNAIGDEGAVQISHVAKTHPKLKALLLEENSLGERGMMAVADAHRNNCRLGMMEVSWNSVSIKSTQVVSASIQHVIYLYLDHCDIGDSHMAILANGLRYNRSIRDLFLEGNQIGLHGARCLAWALAENDYLEGVFLDGNRITRAGAMAFCDVLKTTNMRLRRLQIHDDYHDIQKEIEVYLDMNGAGRRMVLQSTFPSTLWAHFLVQKDISFDADLIYLFLRERPELFFNV